MVMKMMPTLTLLLSPRECCSLSLSLSVLRALLFSPSPFLALAVGVETAVVGVRLQLP